MIKKINIKSVATFDEAGDIIDDLRKINFIYGGNGSGKTTISRLLNNPDEEKYKECSIEWDPDVHEKIFVYNKDFRDKNLKSDIPGIFTLGQATAEQLEAVKKKHVELNEKKTIWTNFKESLTKAVADKDKATNEFKEVLWTDVYKVNQDLKECFKGAPIWHGITKREVMDFSPSLADKVARNTATNTVEEIADEIAELILG